MPPPYRDDGFTFLFADDRRIPRFDLEGVEAGRRGDAAGWTRPSLSW